MDEKWKKINGPFEVSTLGRVRRVDRLMKLIKRKDGYLQVSLSYQGKVRRPRVHQLVARAFIKNLHNKPFINHIDNDTKNNIVSNLEWVTPQENMAHCVKQGRHRGQHKGEENTNAKLNIKKVAKIRAAYPKETQYFLARRFGVDQGLISKIVNYKIWL